MSWKIKWPSQWKERIKTGIVENLIANLYDKTECHTHKKFKTNIKWWISNYKVHRDIKLNHKACLKPYINISTDLRKRQKKVLKNIFSSW